MMSCAKDILDIRQACGFELRKSVCISGLTCALNHLSFFPLASSENSAGQVEVITSYFQMTLMHFHHTRNPSCYTHARLLALYDVCVCLG